MSTAHLFFGRHHGSFYLLQFRFFEKLACRFLSMFELWQRCRGLRQKSSTLQDFHYRKPNKAAYSIPQIIGLVDLGVL